MLQDRNIRPYVDVDIYTMEYCLTEIFSVILETAAELWPNPVICSASRREKDRFKVSFHVYWPGCESVFHCGKCLWNSKIRDFSDQIETKLKPYPTEPYLGSEGKAEYNTSGIDSSVYKKRSEFQLFRVPYYGKEKKYIDEIEIIDGSVLKEVIGIRDDKLEVNEYPGYLGRFCVTTEEEVTEAQNCESDEERPASCTIQ